MRNYESLICVFKSHLLPHSNFLFPCEISLSTNSREICCACARFPLKLEDFPEEITKCSWLFDNFECLLNLYHFFARDKDKVKRTLRFQCIEYLVCVWTAIEYYNLDTNKKTFDTLNLQSCLPSVANLTALSKQVRIWVQTDRSSMLIQLINIYSIQIRVV
jgi:hypothetical protein